MSFNILYLTQSHTYESYNLCFLLRDLPVDLLLFIFESSEPGGTFASAGGGEAAAACSSWFDPSSASCRIGCKSKPLSGHLIIAEVVYEYDDCSLVSPPSKSLS